MVYTDAVYENMLNLWEIEYLGSGDYYVESEGSDKDKGLSKFIKKLIDSIMDIIKKATDKVTTAYKNEKVKRNMAKLKAYLKSHPNDTMDFVDVWKYEKVMKDSIKEIGGKCDKFLSKYMSLGASVKQTDAAMDDIQATIDKYAKQLEEIKKTKVKISTKKILAWIEKQNGSTEIESLSFAKEYARKLEEYQKIIELFDKKAEDFAKENGVIRRPTKFTQKLKNTAMYVKRNADWMSLLIVGFTMNMVGSQLMYNDRVKQIDEDLRNEPNRGDSIFHNTRKAERDGAIRARNDDNNHQKRFRASTGVYAIGTAAASAGIMGGAAQLRGGRRNSV